ncbi:CoF synthetase [Aquimarina sp. 2-A2]|uniref:CoF synthetase n=1 Tax=Aquimarina sp. 2-A2 TaxID=3382644 RepID=UPI00387EFD4B
MRILNLFSGLRNSSFWTLDTLNGGVKRKFLSEIEFVLSNPNSVDADNYKSEKLSNILQHAIKTTNYYKDFRNYKNILDFKIIDKNTLRDNYAAFISKSDFKQKRTVTTSGSTGTPLKIVQDAQKVQRNQMDTLYFSSLAGYRMGTPLYYFRFWEAFKQPKWSQKLMQNLIPVDVFSLSKKEEIVGLLQTIKTKHKTVSFLGYASAFDTLVASFPEDFSTEGLSIESAIAISESLNPLTKKKFSQNFSVELLSRYSNIENGIIAQQPLGNHDHYIINEASYFVEILELNSNNSVNVGEVGRIVITDLFNYAMPLIRYDTGDLGSFSIQEGRKVFSTVYGRQIDVLTDTSGRLITHNLVLIVNKYLEIKQCQLIQKKEGTYQFKINIKGTFYREKEFVEEFKKYLGADADITVVYVDEIPLLASGKMRMMVNERLSSQHRIGNIYEKK